MFVENGVKLQFSVRLREQSIWIDCSHILETCDCMAYCYIVIALCGDVLWCLRVNMNDVLLLFFH